MQPTDLITLGVSVCFAVGGFFLRRRAVKRFAQLEAPTKKQKRPKRLFGFFAVFGAWLFAVTVLALVFRKSANAEKEGFTVAIVPARTGSLFGLPWLTLSHTVITTWGILALVLIAALVIRFTALRRMQDNPKGIQMLLEIMIENLDKYVGGKLEGVSVSFGAYIFSLALLLVASAATELLGLHAPTADITMTLGLSLITFFLINYYGFKRKGFLGRIKSLASIQTPEFPPDAGFGQKCRLRLKSIAKPSTIAFPFRILSDLVVPLSLTCRLFGNMFGGMIIIDLLYYALGSAAIGIPSVAGLFFNIFHPLIQAFIFITLTLSYIEEATAKESE